MGIKGYAEEIEMQRLCTDLYCSIYGELCPGERIALSKLAVEHFERTGRPLRIAVDISIWQFQIQSGKGGSNPALRTLYYRLLRLLALNIQPLFVFDGPHKPPFKRNVRTQPHTACLPNLLAKQLLKLFGFPYHTAPGEAEAECAFFQQEGVVDAVLSEDVDTLMFGCGLSVRNWSSEGTRGNKCATHVNVYDAEKTRKGKAGLDRHGMVLVALMSGGDYIPAGIQGCGIKIACQAARAGFGNDLCKISRNDSVELRRWRERLDYELRTNESGYFRVKHKSLKIPEKFPDKAVLGYYTHPVVSTPSKAQTLKQSLNWDQEVDVTGLRGFVAEAFEWQNTSGAKKFMRGLAPALLVHRLRLRGEQGSFTTDAVNAHKIEQEAQLVQVICGRRTHFITDGMPELRIAYVPTSIVGLDLEAEEADRTFVEGNEISEGHISDSADEPRSRSTSPSKRRAPSRYDPTQPDKIWVLETFVKIGIPLTVESWEEEMRNPKKFASRKATVKQVLAKGGMKKGALDPFVKITKPSIERSMRIPSFGTDERTMPPVFLAPSIDSVHKGSSKPAAREAISIIASPRSSETSVPPRATRVSKCRAKASPMAKSPMVSIQADVDINPWTLSRRPSDTFKVPLPRGARYSALGIYGPSETSYATDEGSDMTQPHDSMSGLASPSPSPSADRKHRRSSSPPSEHDVVEQVKPAEMSGMREPRKLNGASTKPRSPSTNELDSPSPNKKRTPTTDETELLELSQLHTPTTVRRTMTSNQMVDSPDNEDRYALKPVSSQMVNRRLEFTPPRKPVQGTPASVSSSLPSPSFLMLPPSKPATEVSVEIASLPPAGGLDVLPVTPSRRTTGRYRSRRMIALRESLVGTWKEVDICEAGAQKLVYQGVEILDMSST